MSRVIKCEFSVESIRNAIDELQEYRESLKEKINDFVDALIKDGVEVAKIQLASAAHERPASVDAFYVDSSGDIIKAYIVLNSEDALFIEFGSGIRYNNGNAHPLAGEFGYGVGTYPSEHPPNRAINPGYWWYKDGDKLRLSFGTQATMPIYHAAETMRNEVIQKAIEIFKG